MVVGGSENGWYAWCVVYEVLVWWMWCVVYGVIGENTGRRNRKRKQPNSNRQPTRSYSIRHNTRRSHTVPQANQQRDSGPGRVGVRPGIEEALRAKAQGEAQAVA